MSGDREPVTAALVCGFDGDATLRNLIPESRNTLRETLSNHYITAIECDHDAKTDTVRCSCSVWTGTPQPSVGASVRQWVDHVLAAAAPAPCIPEDGADYLCPNCVTPWKCNGPHIPEDGA